MTPREGPLPALRQLWVDADRRVLLYLCLALVSLCAGALLSALAPTALKGMVDALGETDEAPAGGLDSEWVHAAAYVIALCVARVLGEVRPLLMGTAQQRLQGRLSRRYLAHLLTLPAEFHLNRPAGALSQTLNQATAATQLLTSSLLQGLPAALEVITVAVVLFQLDLPLLWLTFASSAIGYALVFQRGLMQVRHSSKAVSDSAIAAHASLADALMNVETIKAFNASPATNHRYGLAIENLQHSWATLHRRKAGLGLASAAVFSASIVATVLVSVDGVRAGALSVGGFVLTMVYMLQMVRPIEALGVALRDLGQAVEFAAPALDVLNQRPEDSHTASDAPRPAAPAGASVDVQLAGLSLSYPSGPRVLDHLSLRMPAGSRWAIVGPSGAGKSSLGRLILGLLQPDAGQILFGGWPSESMALADIRAMIGFVPQDVVLFDDSIAMNVAICRPEASLDEIHAACRTARVHEFILSLPSGYDTRVGPRGLRLSGGERQRIGIARAILKKPRIYLFDEPTSALDGHTEAEVLRDLGRICAGCTTIVITHRLAAVQLAQHIAVLQEGRIVEAGTHAELLDRDGPYARMWQRQDAARRAGRSLA